jgi:hypothetical protein
MLTSLRLKNNIRILPNQDFNTVFHGMMTMSLIPGLKVSLRTVKSSQMLLKKINAGVNLVHLKQVALFNLTALIIWLNNIQIFLLQEFLQVYHGHKINSLMIITTYRIKVFLNSRVEELETNV